MSVGLISIEDPVVTLSLGLGALGTGMVHSLKKSHILPGECAGAIDLKDLVPILNRSSQSGPASGSLAGQFQSPSPQVIRDVIRRERKGVKRLIQDVGALILIGDLAEPMGSVGLEALSEITVAPSSTAGALCWPLRVAIVVTLDKTAKILTAEGIRSRLSSTLDMVVPISIRTLADRLGDRSTWADFDSRLRQIAFIAVGTIWKAHSGSLRVLPGMDPFRAEALRSSGEAVVWAGSGATIDEAVAEALNVPYRDPHDMAKARGIVLLVGDGEKSNPREILRAIDGIRERTSRQMDISVLPVDSSGDGAQPAVALLAYGIPAPHARPERSAPSPARVPPGSFFDPVRIPTSIRMGHSMPRPVKKTLDPD